MHISGNILNYAYMLHFLSPKWQLISYIIRLGYELLSFLKSVRDSFQKVPIQLQTQSSCVANLPLL